MAYKNDPTGPVLIDILSAIDTINHQAPSSLLQVYSEALRSPEWEQRAIKDLFVGTDHPLSTNLFKGIKELVEDPLIGKALPMEIDNQLLDEIVDGLR